MSIKDRLYLRFGLYVDRNGRKWFTAPAKLGDDSHELAVAKEHELINRLMMVMS